MERRARVICATLHLPLICALTIPAGFTATADAIEELKRFDLPELGSRMQDVLYANANPDQVYLQGGDEDPPRPLPNGEIIFYYKKKVRVGEPRDADVYFSFDADTYRLKEIGVNLKHALTPGEAISILGPPEKRERKRVVCDDLECEVSPEPDPEGDVEVLYYGQGMKFTFAPAIKLYRFDYSASLSSGCSNHRPDWAER